MIQNKPAWQRWEVSHEGAVKHWNSLPGELVESPSLEGFKRCGDETLGTGISGGLGSVGFKVGFDDLGDFFQPK